MEYKIRLEPKNIGFFVMPKIFAKKKFFSPYSHISNVFWATCHIWKFCWRKFNFPDFFSLEEEAYISHI